VTSSLENLEHETLTEDAAAYAARAKDGAGRLRRILTAMSEASRVEELMQNTEPEKLDLAGILPPVIAAYRDVYPSRSFTLDAGLALAPALGSPELLVQLLDKLVDNAVDIDWGVHTGDLSANPVGHGSLGGGRCSDSPCDAQGRHENGEQREDARAGAQGEFVHRDKYGGEPWIVLSVAMFLLLFEQHSQIMIMPCDPAPHTPPAPPGG